MKSLLCLELNDWNSMLSGDENGSADEILFMVSKCVGKVRCKIDPIKKQQMT